MSSGVGRGRGWLNLEKKLQNPGSITNNKMNNISSSNLPTTEVQKYTTLIHLLQQMDLEDDGILLNKKFKAFLDGWEAGTKNSVQVGESFNYIYLECLKDYNLTKRFILVYSMFSFHKAEVHGVRLKLLFLQQLQLDFENRTERKVSITEFRNLLCMLSAVFNKSHINKYGNLQKSLGSAILDCFEMLLDSGSPADLELFTSQLWINFLHLKQDVSEKLEKTLLRVRQLLIENNELTKPSRIWLLLALDIVNNQVSWQPSKLYSFYQEELGDEAIANLQELYSVVRSGLFGSLNHSEELVYSFSNSSTISNQFKSGNSNNEKLEHINHKDGNYERIGRPILGVGAQLKKTKQEEAASKTDATILTNERR